MTGRSPAEVVFNVRQYRTSLPQSIPQFSLYIIKKSRTRDFARKQVMKDYPDKTSYVSVIDLKVGDLVLCRQQRVKSLTHLMMQHLM